jgi:hypothetical protein
VTGSEKLRTAATGLRTACKGSLFGAWGREWARAKPSTPPSMPSPIVREGVISPPPASKMASDGERVSAYSSSLIGEPLRTIITGRPVVV